MARISKKFLRLGTGANDVNARDIPANYTPSTYTPTQIASEGTDKISAHLRGINDALANAGGEEGDIQSTGFSYANNQSSPSAVTGLSFNSTDIAGFTAYVAVKLVADVNATEQFTIEGVNLGGSWDIAVRSVGTKTGVAFEINNAGAIRYTSENRSGFSTGTMRFRAIVVRN
jgi:hypothetical protein